MDVNIKPYEISHNGKNIWLAVFWPSYEIIQELVSFFSDIPSDFFTSSERALILNHGISDSTNGCWNLSQPGSFRLAKKSPYLQKIGVVGKRSRQTLLVS